LKNQDPISLKNSDEKTGKILRIRIKGTDLYVMSAPHWVLSQKGNYSYDGVSAQTDEGSGILIFSLMHTLSALY
jgi:hypothetical protein